MNHSLRYGGAPHDRNGRLITYSNYAGLSGRARRQIVSTGGEGRGKCSCGALSPLLHSGYQRKAWHHRHKETAVDPRPEIAHLKEWLDGERSYAEKKWPTGHVDDSISPERYKEWVDQYMHRAIVLGVENPLGRQALGKGVRTAVSFAESIIRRFGELPPPGVPSGEVLGDHVDAPTESAADRGDPPDQPAPRE